MIQLASFTSEDRQQIEDWLISDSSEELKSYKNFSNWFSLLNTTNRWVWIVQENNKTIGFLDLEKIDGIGYFSFYISPEERGKGKSKEILNLVKQKSIELGILSLEAGVNENNIPSQKSLESVGFIQNGKDKDGYLTYTLPIHSSKRI